MDLSYFTQEWREVLELTVVHIELSLRVLTLALAIAVPLGILATYFRPLTTPLLGLLGIIYTVPSLALLAFLIPTLGIGRRPAVIALAVYTQIFLVRNIIAGLRGVNADLLEAGQGLGMNWIQLFWKVSLPLALPVMLAGVRTAVVTTISLATVAAWINAGGLGTLLFEGIARNYPAMINAGAISVILLALAADLLLRGLERFTPTARTNRAVRGV
ncbi:MAG: ABC transporter permease [Chloroflexota bacterium]|nr:ABC transporter permease [Chloroflexota bacterium]